MAIRLQKVKILPELMMKNYLHRAAGKYNKYVGSDILVVYAKSKDSIYEIYEFMADTENFQHLAGVKHPKGANYFYEKCLNGKVTMKDIVPVENIKTTSTKIEVLPQAIDLYSAKIYKIGEKDLETQKCKFTMAIGNSLSVMGMDMRDQILPVPVTVMNRKISDFCSEQFSIFLIMKKKIGAEKYDEIVYEKTKDIFSKIDFRQDIKEKIKDYFWNKPGEIEEKE